MPCFTCTHTHTHTQVITYTSGSVRNSGTDAKVYVDVRGALASTGKVLLQNDTADPFERGAVDRFQVGWCGGGGVPLFLCCNAHTHTHTHVHKHTHTHARTQVPTHCHLGQLVELLVGHDNSGQGPSWFLEQVDVLDPASNVRACVCVCVCVRVCVCLHVVCFECLVLVLLSNQVHPKQSLF